MRDVLTNYLKTIYMIEPLGSHRRLFMFRFQDLTMPKRHDSIRLQGFDLSVKLTLRCPTVHTI
jgi:hypothetical protein